MTQHESSPAAVERTELGDAFPGKDCSSDITSNTDPAQVEKPAVGSNSLPDLAARIRAEHEATSAALKTSVGHAIAAGELLIEAKAMVQHGQWLPWLEKNCALSERTAQLYMRCAKNRGALDEQIRNDVADLTLNEAAAILMLSSDVRKLLAFAKRAESADPDELIALCAAEGIAVLKGSPWGAKDFSELESPEQLEWFLWVLFGVKELQASAEEAFYHADRLQSRGWSLTTEWYGDEGDKYRKKCGLREMPQLSKDDWQTFLASNRDRTIDDVKAEIDRLEEERVARPSRAGKQRRAPTKGSASP